MPAARYHPDHTAHIRRRLADQVIFGTVGLVVTAMAAGVLVLIGGRLDAAPAVVRQLVWIAVAVSGGISVLVLVVSAGRWRVYRRRRADLDAEGAEIMGELKARTARRRADPR